MTVRECNLIVKQAPSPNKHALFDVGKLSKKVLGGQSQESDSCKETLRLELWAQVLPFLRSCLNLWDPADKGPGGDVFPEVWFAKSPSWLHFGSEHIIACCEALIKTSVSVSCSLLFAAHGTSEDRTGTWRQKNEHTDLIFWSGLKKIYLENVYWFYWEIVHTARWFALRSMPLLLAISFWRWKGWFWWDENQCMRQVRNTFLAVEFVQIIPVFIKYWQSNNNAYECEFWSLQSSCFGVIHVAAPPLGRHFTKQKQLTES